MQSSKEVELLLHTLKTSSFLSLVLRLACAALPNPYIAVPMRWFISKGTIVVLEIFTNHYNSLKVVTLLESNMASTIRQRRRRDDEEENANGVNNNRKNNDDDDIEMMMEIFAKHYNNATKHSSGIFGASSQCRFLALLLLFFIIIISTTIIIQYRSSSHQKNTLIRKDLKLITIYPHSLPHNLIHEMSGQTELLITNDNRNVVTKYSKVN